MKFAERLAGNKSFSDDCLIGYMGGPPHLKEKQLRAPLKLKKPSRIGVQFMGDLFHEDVPFGFIEDVFMVMTACYANYTYVNPKVNGHTFLILTKRSQRMKEFCEQWCSGSRRPQRITPNIYLGVTAENQEMFDKRWAYLKQIPAAVYMISYEPALGPLVLPPDFLALGKRVWVVVGGESGPGARPMHPTWVRDLRDQCVEAGVPFFLKQWGEWRGFKVFQNIPKGEAIYCEWRKNFIDPNIDPLGSEFNPDGYFFRRVGKKVAGRMLDGQVYDQMPVPGNLYVLKSEGDKMDNQAFLIELIKSSVALESIPPWFPRSWTITDFKAIENGLLLTLKDGSQYRIDAVRVT